MNDRGQTALDPVQYPSHAEIKNQDEKLVDQLNVTHISTVIDEFNEFEHDKAQGATDAYIQNLTFNTSDYFGITGHPAPGHEKGYYIGNADASVAIAVTSLSTTEAALGVSGAGLVLVPETFGGSGVISVVAAGVGAYAAGVSGAALGRAGTSNSKAESYQYAKKDSGSSSGDPWSGSEVSGNGVKLQTVDDLISQAKPGRETKGKTTQWDLEGGFNKAVDDFNSLNPQKVKDIPNGKTGVLEDGRKINVRTDSSDGRPTLEIQDGKNKIKFRYDE